MWFFLGVSLVCLLAALGFEIDYKVEKFDIESEKYYTAKLRNVSLFLGISFLVLFFAAFLKIIPI